MPRGLYACIPSNGNELNDGFASHKETRVQVVLHRIQMIRMGITVELPFESKTVNPIRTGLAEMHGRMGARKRNAGL